MIELFFIYVDTIQTARKIALISGLRPAIIDDDDITDELIVSLMYAGLKAPNSHTPMYGINPREHVNKIVLIFGMAVHKSKVAISRIILKSLYRRLLARLWGRTASRTVIETASIPVFALWNFIVVRRVMKEIRIRVTLPLLMNDLQENLLHLLHLRRSGNISDDEFRDVLITIVDEDFIEQIFYAYRETYSDPKKILKKYSFGTAHHRAIHLIERHEGLNVSDLLNKLKIRKQSLNRVLKDLIKNKVILLKKGEVDSRQRQIFLNEKGKKLFNEIFLEQKKRIYNAFKNSDSDSVIKFKNVLNKIVNE
jgi:DNA-binding MarR family transcriptional regulator